MKIATKQKIDVKTNTKSEIKPKSVVPDYTPTPCKSCGNKKN
jgi:hypothetical protein